MRVSSANAFRDFDRSTRRELRYVRTAAQEEFLAAVIATSGARAIPVKAGSLFWRAQLGYALGTVDQGGETFEIAEAHPPERMKPQPDKATDGRANPRGIPCLYLATSKETATLEVRPLIGSAVSVAQFKVLRDIRVIDCSRDGSDDHALEMILERAAAGAAGEKWTPERVEKAVWSDINEAFSEPVERGDSSLDYVPTQILAEVFKRDGFDGVAYKSSYGEKGFNVALFDIGAADLINCGLYQIKDVSIAMEEECSPYFVKR